MTQTVHCIKLDKEAPGLPMAPMPGDLGKRIVENVSQEAWQEWMGLQTMLINEKHLSLVNKEHKQYLTEQIEKYFFGENWDLPEGYRPPR